MIHQMNGGKPPWDEEESRPSWTESKVGSALGYKSLLLPKGKRAKNLRPGGGHHVCTCEVKEIPNDGGCAARKRGLRFPGAETRRRRNEEAPQLFSRYTKKVPPKGNIKGGG